MLTILGSLIGFLSSLVPDLFKFFQQRQDNAQELAVLRLQIEAADKSHIHKMEAINAAADAAESATIYRTFYSGVKWVDALSGSVRPVITYGFFILYALVKLSMGYQIIELGGSLAEATVSIWSAEDHALFAGIISFWFGQRAMAKVRK